MKKRGQLPTGVLINTAKATGFSSVSEMLLKNCENGAACTVASPDKKMKMAAVNGDDKNSAAMINQCCDGRETEKEMLEEIHGGKRNAGVQSNQNGPSDCVMDTTKNTSEGGISGNDERMEDYSHSGDFDDSFMFENADLESDLQLPVGTVLKNVAGIDVGVEDVGNALQFLEFCSTFGKILEVKQGQPENVLRDIYEGRAGRCGKFSLTVQFHILLLSIQGEEPETLSPLSGKNSWFHTLKKYLSGSQSVGSLEKAADYETLSASEKLEVLNLLCDEILDTLKVRNWIKIQNKEFAQKIKEVPAAKNKEKDLKKKIKSDIDEALTERNVAALSISEEEAIVSHTKSEEAQAHPKHLELNDIQTNQSCDALRT